MTSLASTDIWTFLAFLVLITPSWALMDSLFILTDALSLQSCNIDRPTVRPTNVLLIFQPFHPFYSMDRESFYKQRTVDPFTTQSEKKRQTSIVVKGIMVISSSNCLAELGEVNCQP